MPKKKIKTDKPPTKEEIKSKIDEASNITEEDLAKAPLEPTENEPVETPESDEPPEKDLQEIEEEEEIEEEAEKAKIDYKQKFSDSSREAQKLSAKNRVLNKAIADADEVTEPTEDELMVEYQDWDVMSDTEKKMAKDNLVTKKWIESIKQAKDQAKKIEKWNEDVENFVDNPKTLSDNPELESKTDEFKEFATQETNNNVPFNILVGAFLHEQSKTVTKNKSKMFESGSGGPNDKPQPKSNKITLDEARILREKDYPKYKELLMKGKINREI